MFQTEVTGIDITQKSINVVSVRTSGSGYVIVKARSFTSFKPILKDDHSVDYPLLVNKLRELKAELSLLGRKIAITIPDSVVVCRSLQIDGCVQGSEREFAICEAFSGVSPVAHQQLRIDFVEEPQLVQKGKVGYKVYAAKKEVVDERIRAVKSAKLTPVLVDTQSHSLFKVWEIASTSLNKMSWLLLYVDSNHSIICTGANSGSIFSKSIPIGLDGEDSDLQLKLHACEELANSLVLQIQIYCSTTEPVEGIWITGNTGFLEQFRLVLEEKLSLQCKLLNPLELIAANNIVTAQSCHGYAYSIALGIAMKGLCWVESV